MEQVTHPNQVWCYDFVHDRCANGGALKLLTVEDEFTRESLAIEVGASLPSARVLLVLDRLFEERGVPQGILRAFAAIMGRSSWLKPSSCGSPAKACGRTSSSRVAPGKMALPRASTASCAKSA